MDRQRIDKKMKLKEFENRRNKKCWTKSQNKAIQLKHLSRLKLSKLSQIERKMSNRWMLRQSKISKLMEDTRESQIQTRLIRELFWLLKGLMVDRPSLRENLKAL